MTTNGHRPLGLVVSYGPGGGGKSTDAAVAFQSHLFVVSAPNVLDPYRSYRETEDGKKLNLKPVVWEKDARGREVSRPPNLAAMVLAEGTMPMQADGRLTPIDTWRELKGIVVQFASAVSAGKCPYRGLVFDEYTRFSMRIWEQLAREKMFRTSAGKLNGYARSDEARSLVNWIGAVAQATRRSIILVCQERPPTYDMEDGSPTKGTLKYKGGPQIVPATNIGLVCGADTTDVVLRLTIGHDPLEGRAIRGYQTEAHPEWESKFRDFRILAKEPLGLKALLERAGYET